MTVTASVLTVLLALVLVATGGAKVAAVPDMRQRADHLGFDVRTFGAIGVLELAGVVGLVVGLFVPLLGLVAAVCLAALMAGAVVAHLRAGDRLAAAAPAVVVGALAVAVAVLSGLRA
jgi:uncharacterized membrane protein YphA (DoxX/SURF4 family)